VNGIVNGIVTTKIANFAVEVGNNCTCLNRFLCSACKYYGVVLDGKFESHTVLGELYRKMLG